MKHRPEVIIEYGFARERQIVVTTYFILSLRDELMWEWNFVPTNKFSGLFAFRPFGTGRVVEPGIVL